MKLTKAGIKTTGKLRNFGTGAVRDFAAGKGRFDLLPFRAIALAALHMERGTSRYGARNWEQGIPVGEFFNSAFRHFIKFWLGATDEPHLDALVWNVLCLAETAERIRAGHLPLSLDNRPALGKLSDREIETFLALVSGNKQRKHHVRSH